MFEVLVEQALWILLDAESVQSSPKIGIYRPDFLVRLPDGRDAIVDVKLVAPATTARVLQAAEALRDYAEAYEALGTNSPPDLVFVTSGVLTAEHVAQLRRRGVETVFDGADLRAAAPNLPWPDTVAGARGTSDVGDFSGLSAALNTIPPGKADWALYQRTVTEILTATLCPPLEQPLVERANITRVNRRDIVFPNYATKGFWAFLRQDYGAYYVIVDAKNLVGAVRKSAVLQMANYLNPRGPGSFGMILCRTAADRSAELTRREQWVMDRKMILVLDDDDLGQMLALNDAGGDASTVIRQKIEDFRLGI